VVAVFATAFRLLEGSTPELRLSPSEGKWASEEEIGPLEEDVGPLGLVPDAPSPFAPTSAPDPGGTAASRNPESTP
jgi:hypothetical protein